MIRSRKIFYALAALAAHASAIFAGAQTPPNPQQLQGVPALSGAAPQQVGQQQKKREVKIPEIEGPTQKLEAGFWEENWPYVIAGAAALAVIIGVALKPRRRNPPTPFETAMSRLASAPKIFDSAGGKKYADEVSQIVRDYLEAERNLPAPERTTEEFLAIAADSKIFDSAQRQRLAEILKLADLAKFAAFGFQENERDSILKNAEEFVKSDDELIRSEKKAKKNEREQIAK